MQPPPDPITPAGNVQMATPSSAAFVSPDTVPSGLFPCNILVHRNLEEATSSEPQGQLVVSTSSDQPFLTPASQLPPQLSTTSAPRSSIPRYVTTPASARAATLNAEESAKKKGFLITPSSSNTNNKEGSLAFLNKSMDTSESATREPLTSSNTSLPTPAVKLGLHIQPNSQRLPEYRTRASSISHGDPASLNNAMAEKSIGRSRILCGGRIVMGPEIIMPLLAFLLLLGPSILFDAVQLPWYAKHSHPMATTVLAIVAISLEVSAVTFFLLTACADPGIIPREASPLSAYDSHLRAHRERPPPKYQDVVIYGYLFKLKFCSTCNIYRGPRTVHCSVCDNCVERFDHHCPWVGNCVGRRNYSRFFFFLLSTAALCLTIFSSALTKLLRLLLSTTSGDQVSSSFASTWREGWDSLILLTIALAAGWFVLGLLGYHCNLVWTAQTTYEAIKGYHYGDTNPWDRGPMVNFKATLCQETRPRYFDPEKMQVAVKRPSSQQFSSVVNFSSRSNATLCGLELCSVGVE